jgi:MFS family permease
LSRRTRRGRRRGGTSPTLITPAFLLVTAATFAYFLCVGALIPAVPRYVEGPLGGSNISVGITVAAFSIAAVLGRPLTGRIGDTRGRRLLIVAGAGVAGVSVLTYSFAQSLPALVALRVVTGIGEAAFYVGAASAINDMAPDERRGEALSFFSLALFAGLGAGPVIGETALEGAGYTAAWLLAGGSALLAAVVGALVPDTRPDVTPQPGGRLLNRAGLLPGAVLGTQVWGLAGFTTFVPLYALHLGLSGSRGVFAAYSVVVLLIRGFGARLPDVIGQHLSARLSLSCSAASLILMGLWQSPAGLVTGAILFGVGQALGFPALMTLAVQAAPLAERASAVGTFTMFFDGAFGLGAFGLGFVAEIFGYPGVFLSAAVVAVAGLALLMVMAQHAPFTEGRAELRRAA